MSTILDAFLYFFPDRWQVRSDLRFPKLVIIDVDTLYEKQTHHSPLGRLEDYVPFPLKPARVWISATPFLAPRFPKKNGTRRDSPGVLASPIAFLETTLREELAHLIARRPDLESIAAEQIAIEPLLDPNGVFRIAAHQGDSLGLRPIQFKRYRQKRGDTGGNRRSGFFKLTFPVETRGPIALGHSCHFGLGLFVPE